MSSDDHPWTTAPESDESSGINGSNLSAGAVVGIVLGGTAFVSLIFLSIVYVRQRRRRAAERAALEERTKSLQVGKIRGARDLELGGDESEAKLQRPPSYHSSFGSVASVEPLLGEGEMRGVNNGGESSPRYSFRSLFLGGGGGSQAQSANSFPIAPPQSNPTPRPSVEILHHYSSENSNPPEAEHNQPLFAKPIHSNRNRPAEGNGHHEPYDYPSSTSFTTYPDSPFHNQ